jgi:integrase
LLFGKKGEKNFYKAINICQLNKKISDNKYKAVFHTLRHTFASWLAQVGTPLPVIGSLLGHKSIRMTERYAHLIPNQNIDAVKALEEIKLI